MMDRDADRMSTPPGPVTDERWIETRRGGIFFINALLIFPQIMVMIPLVTRVFVRARGGFPGEEPIVDTFPLMAEHLLPRMGWLLVIPIALVVYNLTLEDAPWPRIGLGFFLFLHLCFLGWTVGVWTGLVPPVLPGGP
jgi:hypothetical protein